MVTTFCHRIDCATPITGTPVVEPGDPLNRQWCSPECLEAEAEAYQEGHYPSGVAT